MLSKYILLASTSMLIAHSKIRYGVNKHDSINGAFEQNLLKIEPFNIQSCNEEFGIILNELETSGLDIYYSSLTSEDECYVIAPEFSKKFPGAEQFYEVMNFYLDTGLVKISNLESSVIEDFKSKMAKDFLKFSERVAGRKMRTTDSFDYNSYHPLDEVEQWIQMITNENSDRVSTESIGSTYNGNNILIMKIQPEKGPADKTVYVDCGIHAREWISPAFCQNFVKWLLSSESYETDFPGIDSLSKNLNWHIVPVFNPDGYDYTWAKNRMWRKNRVQYGLCTGVDLNRNYAANWGGPGSSGQCTDTYRGPEVFSEKESQAQRDYFDNWKNSTEGQNSPIEMYLTFHSYGQYVIFPYGKDYTSVPENYDELKTLSEDAAMAIKSVYGSTYIYGQTTETLYPAAGGSDDWAYEWGANLSFTYELRDTGTYGFNLPEEQIQPTCEEIIRGVIVMGEHLITRN